LQLISGRVQAVNFHVCIDWRRRAATVGS